MKTPDLVLVAQRSHQILSPYSPGVQLYAFSYQKTPGWQFCTQAIAE
jgi:hypothetical protein